MHAQFGFANHIALNTKSIMQISHLIYCVFLILLDSKGVEREKRYLKNTCLYLSCKIQAQTMKLHYAEPHIDTGYNCKFLNNCKGHT